MLEHGSLCKNPDWPDEYILVEQEFKVEIVARGRQDKIFVPTNLENENLEQLLLFSESGQEVRINHFYFRSQALIKN